MSKYIQTKQELGQKLKFIRERLDLTQKEVADKLCVERSTYTYYETGKTEPTALTLARLAEIFDIDLADIISKKFFTENKKFY